MTAFGALRQAGRSCCRPPLVHTHAPHKVGSKPWHKDGLCKIAPFAKRSRFSPRSLAIHGLLADSSLVHCESRPASCRPHSAGTPLVHGQPITKRADTV